MHADDTGALLQSPHETWFAPAERSSPADLDASITAACGSPVVDAILRAVGCVVAVLNPQRQIVALNHALL